ncbi:ABC transporter permease [Nocardioides sp. BYT-33-1]|uniref:ABC transporter permease n=1 Tax=Nocardioides sp. BYT-33-1 TaxID=3416952 RepID=UPI003F53D32A
MTSITQADPPVTPDHEVLESPPVAPRSSGPRGAALLRYGTAFACLAVIAFFAINLPGTFLTWDNAKGLLSIAAPLLLMAAVLTVPLRVGDFDLSVGYQAQFSCALVVVLLAHHHLTVSSALFVTALVGIGVGVVLGVVIAWSGVSAFVITLAAGSILLGLEVKISDNQQISLGIPEAFTDLARVEVGPVPLVIVLEVVVVGLLWLAQDRTLWGRQVSAVGANVEAARLSGIRDKMIRASSFALVGLGCSLAGILLAAQAQSYYPNAGIGLLLPAYAACFLGSTFMSKGSFHVVGSAVGVVFLAALQNGIVQMNYSPAVANLIQGAVLVLAVMSAQLGRRLAA